MVDSNANKRLLSEFKSLQNEPLDGFCVSPQENNIFKWSGYIFGPEDTEWEDASFYFEMVFPVEYPSIPPRVYFKPPIFHPNVHVDSQHFGMVSMDILKTNWMPSLTAWAILISLRSLLTDPNPKTYANKEAHEMYFKDRKAFTLKVQKMIQEYVPEDPELNENEDEDKNQIDKVESDQKVENLRNSYDEQEQINEQSENLDVNDKQNNEKQL